MKKKSPYESQKDNRALKLFWMDKFAIGPGGVRGPVEAPNRAREFGWTSLDSTCAQFPRFR